jgi:hypothetical protein
VSVIFRIISCFCSAVKTPSMTFTVTIGISVLPSHDEPVRISVRHGRVSGRVTGLGVFACR